jgi:hypothetical protein
MSDASPKLPRDGARTPDFAERLDQALTRALGDHALAHILAAEVSAVCFAVLGGRLEAGAPRGVAFTLNAARNPGFTWGLVLVTVIESGLLHVLFRAAHPALAWTTTGLGAFAILWLVGQDRALSARAISVVADGLVLRAGLRLSAAIPWPLVATATAAAWSTEPPRKGHLDVARPAAPNLVIRLREPVRVTGVLGLRRRVSSVGLSVDDPEGLCRAVEAAQKHEAELLPRSRAVVR